MPILAIQLGGGNSLCFFPIAAVHRDEDNLGSEREERQESSDTVLSLFLLIVYFWLYSSSLCNGTILDLLLR